MRRILVAYDGSDGRRRARDRAITEARDSHGHITVLSVHEFGCLASLFGADVESEVQREAGCAVIVA